MKILKVTTLAPVRLDRYLQQIYPFLSDGKLNKALRENKIKLNGKKQPLSTRVYAGDEIKLFLTDEALENAANSTSAKAMTLQEKDVIFNGSNVLIVNKPAGLAVDDADGDCLITRVLNYLREKGEYADNSHYTPALCHRLDTGTSGLVIIAKSAQAEEEMVAAIKDRKVSKTYLCVTFGRPVPPSATLKNYMIKDAEAGKVTVVGRKEPGSKEIETRYETIAVSGRLALLKVQLITGRTHQIRAHMAHIGCPILGDSKYGNNSANRELKFKYQALCAWKLEFPQFTGEALKEVSGKTFTAAKPWYYNQILDGTIK